MQSLVSIPRMPVCSVFNCSTFHRIAKLSSAGSSCVFDMIVFGLCSFQARLMLKVLL